MTEPTKAELGLLIDKVATLIALVKRIPPPSGEVAPGESKIIPTDLAHHPS